ncbi:lipoate--protein ligase family protein [Pontiella sulfatireligans]|uniref:Lipoate-protein ligase A n=1 Tax=Pontiella sulfatireligans TaxID=2750658 RepID=A0A6C2UMJ4_9BACT|nr:lipoate--protein ligase family protein [Pontiella sulfatireligans]VGO21485.1 Lipoate-protein ligase A [Pontiella sulfatireligans]
MLIVESQSLDVYRNLAIEEYLMEHAADHGPVLFLWRSECAVVMGKNQNPWRECRLGLMRDEGVSLARRISGGGTVYHDAGNLNYCVIVDRTSYKEKQAYEMVFRALEPFGIRAEKTGKSNLSVDGRKFSGNAFAFRKGRALHHGTLLLHTDLERLNRYLGSMFDRIETHAIASVPAQVMNLGIGGEELSAALKAAFCSGYGGEEAIRRQESNLDESALAPLAARQISDAWRYGATPRFTLSAGDVELEVAKGEVVRSVGADWEGAWFADLAFSLVC